MKSPFYKIEVGLSGVDDATTCFNQTHDAFASAKSIIKVIWKGILVDAEVGSRRYIIVHGKNGSIQWSCTSNSNPDINDFELPEPFITEQNN
ncbi:MULTISPECIES: hypothetical protein [unclassified Pseudoalteromonas]|uniref:hypothetical protein n=1 Tax=unclassified Pseudoalteromonas TaxID=194690 RepID=UPI0005A6851E|nr:MULTISPECIES: hypothetical protein [unclassified Pseudoalteromonas]